MTIPRLREITKYQKDNPPLHVMVAAYFGIGKDSSSGNAAERDGDGNSLFDMLPMG